MTYVRIYLVPQSNCWICCPNFKLCSVGTIPAFATIVTDPVAKLYLLPVIIAVAFALAVAVPIARLTLLPVTEKFASAAIVTVPVPIFN